MGSPDGEKEGASRRRVKSQRNTHHTAREPKSERGKIQMCILYRYGRVSVYALYAIYDSICSFLLLSIVSPNVYIIYHGAFPLARDPIAKMLETDSLAPQSSLFRLFLSCTFCVCRCVCVCVLTGIAHGTNNAFTC